MKTLVIGASENPERYSNKAIRMLRSYGHEVVGVGLKEGKVEDVSYGNELLSFENIDTVTLYVGPKNQTVYQEYISKVIQPRRVIFNPGTENLDWQQKLSKDGIHVEVACTLVLLSTNQY